MLAGRVAIVTGAGRGIGAAHARRLAAYGAAVVVNDAGVATDGTTTAEDPAGEVAARIIAEGGEAIAHRGDITDSEVGEELLALALERWGRLDVLVNNAGFGRARMSFNLDDDDWDAVIRVHLRGTFATTRPALRHWRTLSKRSATPAGGRVVNTASGLLLYGGAGQSNYVAAKAGVVAFTDAVATEMAPYGVTVNAIMPSADTRLARIGWRMARNAAQRAAEGVTFDPTDPDHVAEFACYLASDAAAWISGQTFQVRGGIVEHVRTYTVERSIERQDRGWTATDLAGEIPRLFGAGARRADPPPQAWSDDYHER